MWFNFWSHGRESLSFLDWNHRQLCQWIDVWKDWQVEVGTDIQGTPCPLAEPRPVGFIREPNPNWKTIFLQVQGLSNRAPAFNWALSSHLVLFSLRPFLAYQTDFFFKRATNVCTESSVFANPGLSSMNVTVQKKTKKRLMGHIFSFSSRNAITQERILVIVRHFRENRKRAQKGRQWGQEAGRSDRPLQDAWREMAVM